MKQTLKDTPTISSKTIANKIKNLRKNKSITQEQFVCKLQLMGCDISRSTFSKIEAGTRKISSTEINSICKILNIEQSELFN